MTDVDPIAEIQNQSVAEVQEQLPAMTAEELARLRELESADGKPRKGVLDAIEAELKTRGDLTTVVASTAAPAAQADAKADAWRADDYTGPLTADQAAWRHANIKPVQVARTK